MSKDLNFPADPPSPGYSVSMICIAMAGMLQSWKSVRSAMHQQSDGKYHSITIASQKFVFRKNDLLLEIPFVDIFRVKDRVEPTVSSQGWSARIAPRKANDNRSGSFINAMEFSKALEKQGKFGALLSGAIGADHGYWYYPYTEVLCWTN
jgi:hypothetical protein